MASNIAGALTRKSLTPCPNGKNLSGGTRITCSRSCTYVVNLSLFPPHQYAHRRVQRRDKNTKNQITVSVSSLTSLVILCPNHTEDGLIRPRNTRPLSAYQNQSYQPSHSTDHAQTNKPELQYMYSHPPYPSSFPSYQTPPYHHAALVVAVSSAL